MATDPAPAAGADGLPAVWVLHGQPDSSATWWPTRRALQDTVRATGGTPPSIRLLDRPGYGHNPRPATDYAGNLAWLRQELDAAEVDRVVVVGHSWGGGVAVLAAADDPRVVGAVLLASVGPHCLVPSDQLFVVPGLAEVMAWSALGPGGRIWRRWLRRRVRERIDPADVPYARSTAFASRVRPIWRSFLVEQRALLHELTRLDAALPEVDVPVLVVTGRDDHLIPEATADALVARLRRSERVEVPAGHDLNLSAPDHVGRAIGEWLLRQPW